MPRVPLNTIQQLEEAQPRVTPQQFYTVYWREHIGGQLPNVANAQGQVNAYINHSRWVVECPEVECVNANIASKDFPYFVCHECGLPSNVGQWLNVVFPVDAEDLERELLKRPNVVNRNWTTETLADIIAENRQRGID